MIDTLTLLALLLITTLLPGAIVYIVIRKELKRMETRNARKQIRWSSKEQIESEMKKYLESQKKLSGKVDKDV